MDRYDREIRRYFWVFCLGILALGFEITGGLLSGSIALLADAGHVFMDNVAVIISVVVVMCARRSASPDKENIIRARGGYISAILLLTIAIGTVVSAYHRLTNPHEVQGLKMLVFAALSGAINYLQHLRLHGVRENEKHVTHTALHMHILSDMMQSFGVALGGLMINLTGWYLIDPAVSFWIAYRMFRWTIEIWKDSNFQKTTCSCVWHNVRPPTFSKKCRRVR